MEECRPTVMRMISAEDYNHRSYTNAVTLLHSGSFFYGITLDGFLFLPGAYPLEFTDTFSLVSIMIGYIHILSAKYEILGTVMARLKPTF
jgi:hypothetical protein